MPLTVRMDPGRPPAPEDDTTTSVMPVRAHRARRCPTCRQVFSGETRFCPFDGDPLVEADDWNPAADPLLDQVLDSRYRIVRVIGEGGMGTVYEARHVTLDRRFALKVLRRDVAQDRDLCARFIQEAKAAAAIGHPNIVAVSDFGDVGIGEAASLRVPYFVMEFLTGRSLADRIAEPAALDALEIGGVMVQAASALAAAHAVGVVHRDLKPDNVFLSGERDRPFVKLLDFGVAKVAGASRLTRAGVVFGTPHYMSPEQASGATVDHRTDIYALGVMMYECFARRVPFEADTYMGVLTKHMFLAPEPLARAAADPKNLGELAPVVMRCLEKRPEDRYATMTDVANAIEAAIDGLRPSRTGSVAPAAHRSSEPLRLRDPEPFPRHASSPSLPSPPLERGAPRLLLGAAGAAVVAVLAAWALWPRPSAPTAGGAGQTSASTLVTTSAAALPTATATVEASAAPPPADSHAAPSPTNPPKSHAGKTNPGAGAPRKPPRKSGGDVVDPW